MSIIVSNIVYEQNSIINYSNFWIWRLNNEHWSLNKSDFDFLLQTPVAGRMTEVTWPTP